MLDAIERSNNRQMNTDGGASIDRQRRALGDGAHRFALGDAKGPSVQRRRSVTAAYPVSGV